ncbi:hypothetical protein ABH944_005533 [Caballeronia udeis]|uniref:Uncharacterized protein n=1 Tax=Caballeronia udeis TaxID=1232866 RepID=A0ABW8MUJ2_9BURK
MLAQTGLILMIGKIPVALLTGPMLRRARKRTAVVEPVLRHWSILAEGSIVGR